MYTIQDTCNKEHVLASYLLSPLSKYKKYRIWKSIYGLWKNVQKIIKHVRIFEVLFRKRKKSLFAFSNGLFIR